MDTPNRTILRLYFRSFKKLDRATGDFVTTLGRVHDYSEAIRCDTIVLRSKFETFADPNNDSDVDKNELGEVQDYLDHIIKILADLKVAAERLNTEVANLDTAAQNVYLLK